MARRKPDGSHSRTRPGRERDREQGGTKTIIVSGDKQARVADTVPGGTSFPAKREPVERGEVVDIRRVHDVTTGQRRVVVLPADLCRRLGIREGTPLRLVEHDSHFEVVPMRLVPATEGGSYTLDTLLAGVTAENIHGEIDTGPAVGQESW